MLRTALLLLAALTVVAADATVQVDGTDTVRIPLPTGWTAVARDGTTTLLPPQKTPHIQLRAVAGATTLDAAVQVVAAQVADQVAKFTVVQTADITLAGQPARRLTGTGTEADDGDDANAEITIFVVAGKLYLCVAHGEGKGTAERSAELAKILDGATTAH
jgi:hypothetical protein